MDLSHIHVLGSSFIIIYRVFWVQLKGGHVLVLLRCQFLLGLERSILMVVQMKTTGGIWGSKFDIDYNGENVKNGMTHFSDL
jgi:hypothetical protein